jgi:predicted peptidase
MPVPQGAFATRLYVDASGNRMTYYLYGPDGYTPSGSYPLMVVLHGGGERADPSLSAAQNAQALLRQDYLAAFASSAVQTKWPCFVVAPQLRASQTWVNAPSTAKSYTLASTPTPALATVDELIQALEQIYPMIDPNRIYIGGISIGGFGTWDALERWPDIFAAGWVMAGAGDPKSIGGMADDPVWGFQGDSDQIVPLGAVKLMVQAVQAAGGKACYTQYPGAGHSIWNTVRPQRDPRFLAWLFSQTKAVHPSSPPLPCPVGS